MWRAYLRYSVVVVGIVSTTLIVASLATAQDAKKGEKKGAAKKDVAKKKEVLPAATGKPAAKAFYAKYEEWKDMLKKLGDIQSRYNTAKEGAESKAIRKEWNDTVALGEKLLPSLRDAALKAFVEAPNQDRQLTRLLVGLVADAIGQDQYETAKTTADILIKHECRDRKVWDFAGIAAFALHDFPKASEYFKQAQESNVISEKSQKFYEECDNYVEEWKKEQAIIKAQAAKNNPQVRLKTTQGEILIELFEDDAPDTVGNFIHLVESDFYNGLKFHRVLEGFMAQSGCPKGDGSGGPGWNIFDECNPEKYPKYRRHFRGSLSMANASRPNTGGSQFFVTFRPTPNLNGKHTVFGRVIKGLDVLEKLHRVNPDSPDPRIVADTIEKAEVVRKRDHEYVVNKVK